MAFYSVILSVWVEMNAKKDHTTLKGQQALQAIAYKAIMGYELGEDTDYRVIRVTPDGPVISVDPYSWETNTDVLLEKCSLCSYFIEENFPSDVLGAEQHNRPTYLHLDDGDITHDHNATPSGEIDTLRNWRDEHWELFANLMDK